MTSVRIDKWLWQRGSSRRVRRRRSLRTGADPLQRRAGQAGRDVHAGDMLRIKNEGGISRWKSRIERDARPAAVAQTLYRETEASKEARLKAEAERKAMREFAPLPEHRPSKRDRRRIIQFRGGR